MKTINRLLPTSTLLQRSPPLRAVLLNLDRLDLGVFPVRCSSRLTKILTRPGRKPFGIKVAVNYRHREGFVIDCIDVRHHTQN